VGWLASSLVLAGGALVAEGASVPLDRAHPAGRLLRAADVDGDGAVSAEEQNAFLARLDPEGDGEIGRELAEGLMFSTAEGKSPSGRSRMRDQLMLTGAFDQDRDGLLEVASIRQLFAALDANEDGRLGRNELPAALPPRSSANRRRAIELSPTALLLRQMDTDHDGTVTDPEWPQFIKRTDGDSDDMLSEEELERVLPVPPGGESWTAEALELLDRDGDRLVAREELERFVRAADRDANGKVEPAERTMAATANASR
jgi:Ca2+-binding EF-hand superfamily protein